MSRYYTVLILSLLLFGCSKNDEGSGDNSNGSFTIEISSILNINKTSATGEVTLSNNGGSEIVQKGLVWSEEPNPTIDDQSSNEGSGGGSFSSQLSNLLPGTIYYVRAYVKNNSGYVYSNELNFATDAFVFDGHVSLWSQAEVVEFGANNYSEITGHLWIRKTCSDLTPLKNLKVIGEELYIAKADKLITLEGLNNITSVGRLDIFINDNLLTLDGLESLTNISDHLRIEQNYSLVGLGALSNVTNVPGNLYLWNNEVLTNLTGLHNINSVGGFVEIIGNDILPNLEGLTGLVSIGDKFEIFFNDSLVSLSGLPSLNEVGEDFIVERNPVLQDFGNFENLNTVVKDFIIDDNDVLLNIDGLSSLETVGEDLHLDNNDLLVNVDGLSGLKNVNARIIMNHNHGLLNLDGLNALEFVAETIGIISNGQLTDFCGLQEFLSGDGLGETFIAQNNAYNPTTQDIVDGNCSL